MTPESPPPPPPQIKRCSICIFYSESSVRHCLVFPACMVVRSLLWCPLCRSNSRPDVFTSDFYISGYDHLTTNRPPEQTVDSEVNDVKDTTETRPGK